MGTVPLRLLELSSLRERRCALSKICSQQTIGSTHKLWTLPAMHAKPAQLSMHGSPVSQFVLPA